MSVRKRNEFLEGDESEEELENGYGSEAEEGRGAIANKRRKLDSEEDRSDDDISEDDEAPAKSTKATATDSRFDFSHFNAEDEEHGDVAERPDDEDEANLSGADDDDDNDLTNTTTNPKPKKPKDLLAYEAAVHKLQKSGVIYLSRIPPFMKPQTLRHNLLPHAPKSGLGRIFLTPEDPTTHSKRIKNGGNKKKSFSDGWVEFLSKKEAKLAVEKLNGNIIGGKKGGFYHDDIWNLKYLKGFKWDHLTEQIRAENAERTARMRDEVRRVRKENRVFVEDVERGKMVEGMERKRRAKGEREGEGGGKVGDGEGNGRQQMKFKQKKAKQKEEEREKVAEEFKLSEGVRKKIF
ncbi:hypothetical protein CBER1_01791 [Cercospora berteroae]|uniref:18S rRNA factor 2 n=1 Tax=Cercospora berteroae TaxID=357750 RepID=A0A2S6CA23_9PEZI|nr:hypothetical protein CBER1_01791 [Cercospora berteroae]